MGENSPNPVTLIGTCSSLSALPSAGALLWLATGAKFAAG
jgi:hypothetical protein